jgi:hypothetical protein
MSISNVAVTPEMVRKRYQDSPVWKETVATTARQQLHAQRRETIGEIPYNHRTVLGIVKPTAGENGGRSPAQNESSDRTGIRWPWSGQ